MGGVAHAGSGNRWNKKSDASTPFFQMEEKITKRDVYTLKLGELRKIEKEAKQVNKIPLLRFGFVGDREYNYIVSRSQDCKLAKTNTEPLCIITSNKGIKFHLSFLRTYFHNWNSVIDR